jgi:peptidyl-prolyl cis-trans isomerase SurA
MRLFLKPVRSAIALLSLWPLFSWASPVFLGDRSVITVGDRVITHTEFTKERDFYKLINGIGKQTPQQEAEFDKKYAEFLLDVELQIQAATLWNLDLDDNDKKMAVQQMLIQNGAASEQELILRLRERDIDVGFFYHQGYRQFFLNKIHGLVLGQRIRLSDAEVTKVYEKQKRAMSRYYVEDVTFNTERKSQARQKLLSERAGALSETWKQSKLSSATVPNGSKMISFKWQTLDELPQQFRDVLASMSVGQVSAPIKTDNGYHVLKVIKIKQPEKKALDRDQLRQMLFMQKMAEELPRWVADLKEQMYTRIDL